MKVNCLACGFNIGIGDAYDDYEGQIRCYVCHNLMEIKTVDGRLKSVKRSAAGSPGRGRQAEARV